MAEVANSAGLVQSLDAVKRTTSLASRAQEALSSGRRVNRVTDDPFAFFIAKSLSDKANTLTDFKSGVDQAISSVSTANIGLDAINSFARQLKGVAEAARSASPSQQSALSQQFREIGNQISQIAQDTSFQGQNLLSGGNQVQAQFSDREESQLTISGFDLNTDTVNTQAGLFSVAAFDASGAFDPDAFGLTGGEFSSIAGDNSAFDDISQTIDSAIERLRGQQSQLGTNVATLQERVNFTERFVNELETGADKLTLADLNEEAASFVAANTRSQIGINSIALAGQQSRSILELLGQA